jgi:small-conductance mechanosensitive channel
MQGILYEEASIWQFLFITLILGGWAAWMTGRACAQTWRPYLTLVVYLLALGLAVRFIHHALFEGTMFSLRYYIVDTIVLLICGTLGYRYTRTNQMTSQYHWLYDKVSPFSWKAK